MSPANVTILKKPRTFESHGALIEADEGGKMCHVLAVNKNGGEVLQTDREKLTTER